MSKHSRTDSITRIKTNSRSIVFNFLSPITGIDQSNNTACDLEIFNGRISHTTPILQANINTNTLHVRFADSAIL